MNKILFDENPATGHKIIAKNLLNEPWTHKRLMEYVDQRPVCAWFNPAALDSDTVVVMFYAESLLTATDRNG